MLELISKNKFAAIFLAIAAIVYCAIEAKGEGDFYIFVSAAHWIDGHTNVYAHKFIDFYHYYYSILFALLLKPFFYLPYYGVRFAWIMLNICLFSHLFVLLARSSWIMVMQQKQQRLFLFLVFLFSLRFLHENLHLAQVTILILWCSVYGLYCIHTNKTLTGSLLIALSINIKLLPLVLLPYLVYRKFFKAFIIVTATYIVSLFLPGVIIGNSYNLQLLGYWWELINPANEQHIMDVDERSFHSLTTLLTTLFIERPPDYYAMDLPRHLADVSLETLKMIILGTRLCLIGFVLFFLSWPPFKKATTHWQSLVEISYLLLLIPLIFPHQQHYAFLFSAPAFAVVLYFVINHYAKLTSSLRVLLLTGLILSYITTNLKLLLGEFNRYYEHYKILTYGTLLLIAMLALVWALSKKKLVLPETKA